jgi:hypothetical protein
MKKLIALLAIPAAFIALPACNNSSESESTTDTTATVVETAPPATATYVNLQTGATVHRDATSGVWVDDSGTPAEFYVDMSSMDTFYGKGDVKVNSAVVYENDVWKLDPTKVKVDGDEIKIKYADGSKEKIDGDEHKVKDGDTKMKSDGDEVKVK